MSLAVAGKKLPRIEINEIRGICLSGIPKGELFVSNEDKIRMTVDIFGNQYKLVAQTSVPHMKRVVAQVNEQMQKISAGSPRLDTPKIAVLAAVHMSDDYCKIKYRF
jgi:cell division protein ZapA (FtsZ GTPase activity inhibitor)